MAYEEIHQTKSCLISVLSMRVSQRTKWIVLSCWICLQTFTFLQGFGWMTVSWRLTSVAFRESERRQGRLRDRLQCWCNSDWITPLQLYSSTEFWVWYLMERKTLKRCGKERGAKSDREVYGTILRDRKNRERGWWSVMDLGDHSAVKGSEQLIWYIDEDLCEDRGKQLSMFQEWQRRVMMAGE